MNTRRKFLNMCAVSAASLYIPGCSNKYDKQSYGPMKNQKPEKALVLWYSQAGHTERNAKLMAKIWEKQGLNVDVIDILSCDKSILINYDLILIGTPVFYYDTPINVKNWLKTIPKIDGIPVAAFVTCGGPEGNQHNAVCSILELLADKGGVPVHMQTFVNMSTMPTPSWDSPGTLAHKHLPNKDTYDTARKFASDILLKVEQGRAIDIERKIAYRQALTWLPLIKLSKLPYDKHTINKDRCISCGTCTKKCPTGAIDLSKHSVNRDKCILCFGCLNNCPEDAVDFQMMGKKLYGFPEFLKRNNIIIREPVEFKVNKT